MDIKIEALKKLFKYNLDGLSEVLGIDNLKVEFKGDEFFILDKDNKVIFNYKTKYYDLDFNSQKKFIMNVASKVVSWIENLNEYEDNFKYDFLGGVIDSKEYIDVLGEGDIYKRNFIKLKDYVIVDDSIIVNNIDIIEEIRKNLNGDKIRVVLYNPDIGFYVDGVIKEKDIYVYYIEDIEDIEDVRRFYINNDIDIDIDIDIDNDIDLIDEIICDEIITLYYSKTTKKEIEKAVKFIKDLVD